MCSINIKKDSNWSIICTANPEGEDYSITTLDDAMLSRMMHVTLKYICYKDVYSKMQKLLFANSILSNIFHNIIKFELNLMVKQNIY